MLNKILIKLLNYKTDKIASKKCKSCIFTDECYCCDFFCINHHIKAIIKVLKERKI